MNVAQIQIPSPQADSNSSGARVRWMAALIAVVAVGAFCPILFNGFIQWDDKVLVADNVDFRPPNPAQWGHYWGKSRLYMPMTHMLWGVVAMAAQTPGMFGRAPTLNPAMYHGVSLLLHAANAILVLLILRKCVAGDWPALFGALLFAVHPLQTEVVAWVAETSILLSTFFSLIAVLAFMKSSDSPHRRRRVIGYVIATIAMALALLSKPVAVVVPVMVLIIEGMVRRKPVNRTLWAMAPWLVMSGVIGCLVHRWQTSSFTFALWKRPIIASDALAFYLYKLFVPIGLLPNYCRTPQWLFDHPLVVWLTWLAPAALLVLAIVLWKRARWVAAAALIFVVALAPVLGLNVFVFQQFSTTADRYVYLGMLGPALALAVLLSLRSGRVPLGACGVMLAILVALSIRQATYWVNTVTLFSRVIAVHPDSRAAQELVAIGYNYESRDAQEAQDYKTARANLELAREHFLIAAALPDDDGISYYNAADCLFRLGRPRPAFDCLTAALNDRRFQLRAKAWNMMGKRFYEPLKEFDYAAECYTNALQASRWPQLAQEHEAAQANLNSVRMRQALISTQPTTAPATAPAP